MRVLLLLILVLGSLGPLSASEDPYDRILDRFREFLSRGELEKKAEGLRLLDPNHPKSIPELRNLLLVRHWFVRGHAAESLSRVTDPALRAELRLDLITHEEPLVREGMALAFYLGPLEGDADALAGALSDPAWEVRRTAALALSEIVSKDSIETLIGTLTREADTRVAIRIADTLRKITGLSFGRDAEAWSAWWKEHRDDPGFEKLEEEVKRRPLSGIPLETVTVARPREPGPPGRGRPEKPLEFFVLAPLGFTHDIYRPWLDELGRFGRVTYVKLPRLDVLRPGTSGFGAAVPVYPVGALVRALEELRKELGKGRVVVIGEGAAGWIASAYAFRYPETTAGFVILSGYVDAASYVSALLRLLRSDRRDFRWVAETLTNQNEDPHDRLTYDRIARIRMTMDLGDPADSFGFLALKEMQDVQGFVTVPEFRLPERLESEIPALFLFGMRSPLNGYPEHERIRAHFKNVIVAPMKRSGGFPWRDEIDEFYRVFEGFLVHHGLVERK